jgi:hypothetical protein
LGDERRSMRAFSYVQVDLSDDDWVRSAVCYTSRHNTKAA